MSSPNELLGDAEQAVRALLHGTLEQIDTSENREGARSLLWKLSELVDVLGGSQEQVDALRKVGDTLTDDVGAAERVRELLG